MAQPKYDLTNTGVEVQEAINNALSGLPALINQKANRTDVLTKDNITPFTPTSLYHPATKKYVDDKTVAVAVGTTTTGEPGTNASVVNSGTNDNPVLDFTIPRGNKGDKGDKGDKGIQGLTGPSNTLTIGTVDGGDIASATITGDSPSQTLNLVLPRGERGYQGLQGIQGAQGEIGPANTLTIGTVVKDDNANATITGTSPNQILNLVLPKGDKGDTGAKGDDGNGIDNITKTDTTGLVDTYTITYTDETTDTFTVTNGEDGESYTLPTASTTVLGGVKVDGTTITISDGVISGSGSYTDEMAQDAVGGMVDASLTYTDGTPELKVTNPVTPQAIGFSITAGTTPKTLTVGLDASVSGTNTGDQTLPVKATGAEINAGTDDAKFATSKAISDSKLARIIQGTSNTAGTTAAKTTTIADYTLRAGDTLAITFSDGFSVNNATLNVNGSGDIAIRAGAVAVTTALLSVAAATSFTLNLYYDGTYFYIPGSQLNTNTTYTEISEAEITAGTATTARTLSGRRSEFIVTKARNGKEDTTNKENTTIDTSTTKYPTVNLLKTGLDAKVDKSTYDANSILYATDDNTPLALTVGASTIVGRKASGNIVALTKAETLAILNVADGATANTKAAGSDINTGTDDTKYITSKAVTDSKISITDHTEILTNKAIVKRVVTTTDDATAVIDVGVTDIYELSAVANATTFSTTGSPTDGQKLMIRFKDAGTAKALTWDAVFVAIGVTAPTTTVAGKWHYVGCEYNAAATKWHILAVAVEA